MLIQWSPIRTVLGTTTKDGSFFPKTLFDPHVANALLFLFLFLSFKVRMAARSNHPNSILAILKLDCTTQAQSFLETSDSENLD